MAPRTPNDSNRELSTWTALLGLLVISGGLIFLAALVVPQVLGIVLVVLGFGGMFVLHYLTWGWWLSRLPPPEDVSEER